MNQFAKLGLGLALSVSAVAAHAQDPVKIGFITTLSTPAGYIGEDERDGFALAIQQEGGKLGGVPVSLVVEDDGLKPSSGKQSADKMLQEGIRLFTGINFSNVMIAVAPAVVKEGGFYVSLNAGPSNFAGKGCDKNLFSVGFQNDSHSDTAAMAANEVGIKKIVLVASAYQAGRDALSGFKREFKGEVLAEIYTKLDQSDYSVELARIRSLNPDGVFQFLPGGAGINFGKQFANSGLNKSVKMVTTLALDDRMLAALGDAADGYYLSTLWTASRDNQASKTFVADFEKAFKRRPSSYAATAYDTARVIGSALKAVDGDYKGKPDQFRAALRKADFQSVRGSFHFGPNQYPVQDWSLAHIERNADGKLDYKVIKTLVKDHGDVYSHLCKMNG
jgi:branched-chain amino acid transport system substrate-binding protein